MAPSYIQVSTTQNTYSLCVQLAGDDNRLHPRFVPTMGSPSAGHEQSQLSQEVKRHQDLPLAIGPAIGLNQRPPDQPQIQSQSQTQTQNTIANSCGKLSQTSEDLRVSDRHLCSIQPSLSLFSRVDSVWIAAQLYDYLLCQSTLYSVRPVTIKHNRGCCTGDHAGPCGGRNGRKLFALTSSVHSTRPSLIHEP